MRSTMLKTITSCLALVAAAPVAKHGERLHRHDKRVDWNAINYDFSGVDWSTVKYDLSNVDWSTVFATPAATPVATAAQVAAVAAATEQVVVNGNQVEAIPATTTISYTTTQVPAGNVATQQPTLTSTSTPTAATTQTSSTTTYSSGKRGLGWDPASPVDSASILAGNGAVSWYFDWSTGSIPGLPSNWQFYANIWNAQGIENLATTLKGSPRLIGFNEPDSATQANIGVDTAVSLYKQYLTPLRQSGVVSQLGSPAVTNSQNSGEGLDYLSKFMSGCADCQIDFAVVHWYAESLDDFKNHVTSAHTMTGLPVNVAEFAYTSWNSANEPSPDEVLSFMTQAIAWLEAQSFVQAYAWFGSQWLTEAKFPALGSANSLIDQNLDGLTALGAAYCG